MSGLPPCCGQDFSASRESAPHYGTRPELALAAVLQLLSRFPEGPDCPCEPSFPAALLAALFGIIILSTLLRLVDSSALPAWLQLLAELRLSMMSHQPHSSPPLRLAINGYGRIGRCYLRALSESPHRPDYRVVAINEPADLASIAYLTRFDSTHGRFPGEKEYRTFYTSGLLTPFFGRTTARYGEDRWSGTTLESSFWFPVIPLYFQGSNAIDGTHCNLLWVFDWRTAPEGGLTWTRGEPKRFRSSNHVLRGFCAECGTPLTFEAPDGIALAIGAFDNPEEIAPTIQWGIEAKLPYADAIPGLPGEPTDGDMEAAAYLAGMVNYQHPDHDTETWPAEERP